MQDKKINLYSATTSTLTTGVGLGVNEMAESGTSMFLTGGRRLVVEGMTKDMEEGVMKDMLQDGMSSAMSMWSGGIMQLQESAMQKVIAGGGIFVAAQYSRSKIGNFMKGKKGRKLGMLSKFFGANDKKAEEARLIADFTKMNVDSNSSSNNPLLHHNKILTKQRFESIQVQKEGVMTQITKVDMDGSRDIFEMKIKTSSFFNTDKRLIQQMTGITVVTDKEIKKLNALSSNMVFQDSSGNWIGGSESSIALLNSLSLQRV